MNKKLTLLCIGIVGLFGCSTSPPSHEEVSVDDYQNYLIMIVALKQEGYDVRWTKEAIEDDVLTYGEYNELKDFYSGVFQGTRYKKPQTTTKNNLDVAPAPFSKESQDMDVGERVLRRKFDPTYNVNPLRRFEPQEQILDGIGL